MAEGKRPNQPKIIAQQEHDITLLRNQVRNMTIGLRFLRDLHVGCEQEHVRTYITETIDNAEEVLHGTEQAKG
ncbi:hypothetical protein [Vibrio sp. 1180_3]|uniref:hypothetical protein n=1 Tax=Vibrio sp. 1180_3 TaxID=2528832 RepID=UPI0024057C3C|nr:hypothetical protein [Vibrio sp. 1180_3]EJC7176061.1 hypothetical protein [Vibrio parahaemolyticus]EJG0009794.1 hypothetical protein [Vibrio parahaemolyticus]MDF9399194.1 hypothetical protein [Vibrio sp. 1180_3]